MSNACIAIQRDLKLLEKQAERNLMKSAKRSVKLST